jgi:hypothetical protein
MDVTKWKTVELKIRLLSNEDKSHGKFGNHELAGGIHIITTNWQFSGRGAIRKPLFVGSISLRANRRNSLSQKRSICEVILHNWVSLIENCCVRFDYYFIPGREGESIREFTRVRYSSELKRKQKQCVRCAKQRLKSDEPKTNGECRSVGEWPSHSLAAHCVSLSGRTALQR